jgi:hypothetical protein
MRRFVALSFLSLAALATTVPMAEAQTRRSVAVVETVGQPVVLRVRPRSFLDAGNVVAPGTTNRYATQDIVSYVNSPPYAHRGELYGAGILPDPIGGPFVGARNPFGPVDYAFR